MYQRQPLYGLKSFTLATTASGSSAPSLAYRGGIVSPSSFVISLCLRRPLWLSFQVVVVMAFPFSSSMVSPLLVSSLTV